MTIPLSDQLVCAKRQADFIRRESPSWVARGKWTQEKADRELACATAVVATVARAMELEQVSVEIKGRPTEQVQLIT